MYRKARMRVGLVALIFLLLFMASIWDGKHEEAPLFVPTEETYIVVIDPGHGRKMWVPPG